MLRLAAGLPCRIHPGRSVRPAGLPAVRGGRPGWPSRVGGGRGWGVRMKMSKPVPQKDGVKIHRWKLNGNQTH